MCRQMEECGLMTRMKRTLAPTLSLTAILFVCFLHNLTASLYTISFNKIDDNYFGISTDEGEGDYTQ